MDVLAVLISVATVFGATVKAGELLLKGVKIVTKAKEAKRSINIIKVKSVVQIATCT